MMKGYSFRSVACVIGLVMVSGHGAPATARRAHITDVPQVIPDGYDVARELDARFNDYHTVRCGGDKPAYFCSGIVIRGISSEDCCFWNNRERDGGYIGVSFSYLRYDLGVRALARDQGFIFRPADTWGKGSYLPLSMLCSFAFDAFTGPQRGNTGCGAHVLYPIDGVPCADQGIETVAAFARHYASITTPQGRFTHQCSFGVDWRSFHLSILARQGGNLEPFNKYSEQVIGRWPNDMPERLPFEALFYIPDGLNPVDSLAHVRQMQRDYQAATGVALPIMRFHADPNMPVFTYHPADQAAHSHRRQACMPFHYHPTFANGRCREFDATTID